MKRKSLYIFLFSLSLAGYAWVAWNVVEDAGHSTTPTVCLFKAVTHLPCPSCGSSRALILLAKGDVSESVMLNPFGTILAIALVIVPFWIVIDIFRRRESLFRWYIAAERALLHNRWLSIPAVALVLVNWIWNITKEL